MKHQWRLPAAPDDQIPDTQDRSMRFLGALKPEPVHPQVGLPTESVEPRERGQQGPYGGRFPAIAVPDFLRSHGWILAEPAKLPGE